MPKNECFSSARETDELQLGAPRHFTKNSPKGRSLTVIITPAILLNSKWKSTTIVAVNLHQVAEAHIFMSHKKIVGYLDLSKAKAIHRKSSESHGLLCFVVGFYVFYPSKSCLAA